MTSTRWYRPAALLLPAVGLVAQELWSFSGIYLGETRTEQVQTAAGWALWVAVPHLVVAVLMVIALRSRSRAPWWIALAAGAAVILVGLGCALAVDDDSTDPLAGLPTVVAPLAQLSVALPLALSVLVLTFVNRRTRVVEALS